MTHDMGTPGRDRNRLPAPGAHGGVQHSCWTGCEGWVKTPFQEGVEAERKRILDQLSIYGPTVMLPTQIVFQTIRGER